MSASLTNHQPSSMAWQSRTQKAEADGIKDGWTDDVKGWFIGQEGHGVDEAAIAKDFTAHVQRLVLDATSNLSEVDAASVRTQAEILTKTILHDAFGFEAGASRAFTDAQFSFAVVKANALAAEAVLEARGAIKLDHTPPQLTVFQPKDGSLKLNLIQTAAPIENLVLRGGGGKGLAYGPTLTALDKSGALDQLDRVIGTSAGALTATVMAAGVSATAFEDFVNKTPTDTLKQTSDNFDKLYPTFSTSWVGYKAGNMINAVDKLTGEQVQTYLHKHWDQISQNPNIAEGERARLQQLMTTNMATDRSHQMVTFGDMALLHRIDPAVFKLLSVTAWVEKTGKPFEFTSDAAKPAFADCKDIPLAFAARASMAIPVYFSTVKLDINGKTVEFTDGGVGSNMPAHLVPGWDPDAADKGGSDINAGTLLMTFDDGGEANNRLHVKEETPWYGKAWNFVTNTAAAKFTGNPGYGDVQKQDQKNEHTAGPNTLSVKHGSLGTLSMSPAEITKEFANYASRGGAATYVLNRLDQADYKVFELKMVDGKLSQESIDQILGAMKQADRLALVEAGPPQRAEGETDISFAVRQTLYDYVEGQLHPEPQVQLSVLEPEVLESSSLMAPAEDALLVASVEDSTIVTLSGSEVEQLFLNGDSSAITLDFVESADSAAAGGDIYGFLNQHIVETEIVEGMAAHDVVNHAGAAIDLLGPDDLADGAGAMTALLHGHDHKSMTGFEE
ncbi:patatin-like phospholipase family protein [Acidisoma silvae]|uniref:Patatin-like phospholipase family protein n=1 Tax=Acidisoma silvae TaxID=2802396 RepID=A0A963YSL9_9PROT|nr:patatin-like phospholipase family protein [Acidisoma silvae]MCB8875964.1 patatin-like phospholipase family protein [Acidisoma silvae]